MTPRAARAAGRARRRGAVALAVLLAPHVASAHEPTDADAGLGTAHPGLVEAADPEGRWVVLCQARADTDGDGKLEARVGRHGALEGDRLEPYLVVGRGAGTAIGRLLAVDPTSRWVVGAPAGRVTLYDTEAGTPTDLGAPREPGPRPETVPTWAAFDASGRRLLTARVRADGTPAGATLRVRDLASGREQVVGTGPGLLVRAALSADGSLAVATMVVADTDRDGRLGPARAAAPVLPDGCAGGAAPPPSGARSDAETPRIVAVDGSERRDVPGFVAFVGGRWVRTAEDGALVLEGMAGAPRTLAPAAARARVLAVDDDAGQVLFVGSGTREPARVQVADADGTADAGVALRVADDAPTVVVRCTARCTPLGADPDRASACWDRERRVAHAAGRFLACADGHVLLLRDRGLVAFDPETGTEVVLPGPLERSDAALRVRTAGGVVAVAGRVVDVRRGRLLGIYDDDGGRPLTPAATPPWAVRADGALLVAAAPSPAPLVLPPGPFRWTPPTPGPADDDVARLGRR